MKKLILLLGFIASPVLASDWVKFDADGQDHAWFVDADSMKIVGNIRQVWTKMTDRSDGGGDFALIHYRIDCYERTFKPLAIAEYKEDGRLISSQDFRNIGSETGESIPPDSVGDHLAHAICR